MKLDESEQKQVMNPTGLVASTQGEKLSGFEFYDGLPKEVQLNILEVSNFDSSTLWNFLRTGRAQRSLVEEYIKKKMYHEEPLFASDIKPLFAVNTTPWFTTYISRHTWINVLSQLAAMSRKPFNTYRCTSKCTYDDYSESQKQSLQQLEQLSKYYYRTNATAFANLCAYFETAYPSKNREVRLYLEKTLEISLGTFGNNSNVIITMDEFLRNFMNEYQLHIHHKNSWAREFAIMLKVLFIDQLEVSEENCPPSLNTFGTRFQKLIYHSSFFNEAISDHIFTLFIEGKNYLYQQLEGELSYKLLKALACTFHNRGIFYHKNKSSLELKSQMILRMLNKSQEIIEKAITAGWNELEAYEMAANISVGQLTEIEEADKTITEKEELIKQYALIAQAKLEEALQKCEALKRNYSYPQYNFLKSQEEICIKLGRLNERNLNSLKKAILYYIKANTIQKEIVNLINTNRISAQSPAEVIYDTAQKILTVAKEMVERKEDFSAEVITWLNKYLNDGEEHGTDPAEILGKIYYYGLGVEQDLPKAMKFFADMDYYDNKWITEVESIIRPYNTPEQQLTDTDGLILARIFKENLLSVPQPNYDKCIKERYAPYIKMAIEWLQAKAETTSSSEIKYLLGYYYIMGVEGEQNIEVGEQLIFQQAEQEDNDKKNYFAINYKIARSKGKSVQEAIILAELAHERIIKDVAAGIVYLNNDPEEKEESQTQ
ncbi:SEL1-like repeat protein [Candidatus Odyssella thessalonicensis]|uniref:SEL1-like repeat protein n=1 Tax=Candidatus Odyssella thessalonicensis TaxID=84647 RepID=UPI000225B6E1|nr:SEL1-like repeat protein [Candidatus Odyssella thessalonicensis]